MKKKTNKEEQQREKVKTLLGDVVAEMLETKNILETAGSNEWKKQTAQGAMTAYNYIFNRLLDVFWDDTIPEDERVLVDREGNITIYAKRQTDSDKQS